MTHSTDHPGPCPPHLLLQDRCRVLGLPTWRFGADGVLLSAPGDSGHLGEWLRSSALERVVGRTIDCWRTGEPPRCIEAAPGLSLIPFVQSQRRKRTGFVVAAALGPGIIDSPLVEEGCEQTGLSPEAVRGVLAPMAVYSRSVAERLALCLGWGQSDLNTIADHQSSIAGFSRQLAESYEEITLLQKLGLSMNQMAHPQKFVSLACDELQKTLPYEWVAVRFVADRRLARAMAGRLYLSGRSPCDRMTLESETARLMTPLKPNQPMVLGPEGRGRLGSGQSHLLVHPVAREDGVVAALFAGGRKGDDPQVSSTDIKLFEAAGAYLSILLDNAILYDDQQLMFVGTLEAMTSSIDAKDPYTCGHSERVAELAAALAAAHGLDEQQVERIRLAGIVHDVGKIGVPEAVLCKAGRLTDEEFGLIKQHPEIGYQILRDIPLFEDLLPGVLYHHERMDGKGYPRGLAGSDIPLMARIIGLVDAFDAMSSNRTYRSAMPRERVFDELEENAGSQFDPALVTTFKGVDLFRYDELVEKHQARSHSGEGGLRIRRTGIAA